jgi:hypothetical protein
MKVVMHSLKRLAVGGESMVMLVEMKLSQTKLDLPIPFSVIS